MEYAYWTHKTAGETWAVSYDKSGAPTTQTGPIYAADGLNVEDLPDYAYDDDFCLGDEADYRLTY